MEINVVENKKLSLPSVNFPVQSPSSSSSWSWLVCSSPNSFFKPGLGLLVERSFKNLAKQFVVGQFSHQKDNARITVANLYVLNYIIKVL